MLAGLRSEGFLLPSIEVDAEELLDFLLPLLEPIAQETFTFSRAWLRGGGGPHRRPAVTGLGARPVS